MRDSRSRRGVLRRSAAAGLLGAVLAAVAVSATPPAAAAPAPAGPVVTGLLDTTTASSEAAATGRPVVVTSLTSPTQLAVAQPNGEVTATFSAEPVRAQAADGSWVPVDTTLALANGLLAPKAATVPITFSNGGSTAPLASMTRAGGTYQVYSPWPLPVPVVSGASATYRSVLPGVDLVVVAQADGFSDNVVIENADAAANPALSAITFPVRLSGLRQVQDPGSGTVDDVDAQGRPVFSGDAPSMWDSRGASATPSPAAAVVAAPATARSVTMPSTATGSSVTIRPDRGMLDSPTTTFPVVLDPVTKASSMSGYTVLDREFHSHAYWKDSPDPSGFMSVGYDGYDTGSVRRSVVQFGTSALAGKQILGATFTAFEVWSASCTKYEVDLYRTSAINSSSSWDKPPTWQSKVDSQTVAHGWTGSGSSCSTQSPVEFDAKAAVAYTAGQSSSSTALGMRATSSGESTAPAWKQFAKPSGSHIPTLSVTYLSKPSTPTSVKLATPNLSCATSSTSPTWIGTTTPRLQAKLADADGSNSTLKANFQVYTGTTKTWSQTPSGTVASGATVYATTSALKASTLYYYQARAEYDWSYSGSSGATYSAWSAKCYFEIDTTAPASPSATSATYAACATPDDPDSCPVSGGVGQPATFTFTSSADAKTFLCTLNSGVQVTAAATVSGTTTSASVTVNPNVRGLNILQVEAKDAAGNVSQTQEYDFSVAAGTRPVGVWSLDESSGTSLADSTSRGTAHPATLGGGYGWEGTGRTGTSVSFDGTTGYAETSAPVVNTATSFSVSGWIRLSSLATNATIASQHGVHENGFDLYYSSTYGWVFCVISADDTVTRTIVRATSPATPALYVWTHLTGVYDSTAKTITLYVNGVPGPPTAHTTPWNANGPMDIGRRWFDDAWGDFATARIDDIEVWDRVLSPQEIDDDDQIIDPATGLATPDLVRHWPVTETAGPTVADTSGYFHDLTLAGAGASIVTDPDRGQVIALDGTSGYGTASTCAVDAQGSFTATAWVNLSSATLGTAARTAQVFAQAGTNSSTWGLWYAQTAAQAGSGFWYFGTTSVDASSATTTSIVSDDPAETDGWVMLSIVYDAPGHQLNLYVNGIQQGDGVTTGLPWQGTGVLAVGRGLAGGTWGRYFPGSIDEATVSAGVTSQSTLLTQYVAQVQ